MEKQRVNSMSVEATIQTKSNIDNINRAKIWQIGFFASNNTATNMFMFLMMNVAYYATGIAGLGTVIVSTIITGSRIWDGFTDPVIGYWMDKTDGKFGKFRPFLVLGYLTMSITVLLIFFTTHKISHQYRLAYFIFLYAIHIIGYTFQTAVTKSGQSVLTNDPKQRPIFSTFDISFTALLFAGAGVYLSNYLVPKYGGFNNVDLFSEFAITVIILAGILTLLAILGIWEKDRTKFFGAGNSKEIRFKDMWNIIKENKPLQMLIVAASTDKLGQQIAANSIVMVMLFGIIIGDYALFGIISGLVMIPNVIIAIFGTSLAGKFGTKSGYVWATWLSIIFYLSIFFLLVFGDPSQIQWGNWNIMTITFIVLYIIGNGIRTLSGGLVIPMIPDVTDYETYKTGRYAPGLMGTIFSFIDKLISSLAQTVIGLSLAFIGFNEIFPDIDTPFTKEIFWVTMFLFIGVLMFAWIASLIAMKFYPLDRKMMNEIQIELARRKEQSSTRKSL